nr:hypothetical protein GCM10020093_119480 [Planobispora longispora]
MTPPSRAAAAYGGPADDAGERGVAGRFPGRGRGPRPRGLACALLRLACVTVALAPLGGCAAPAPTRAMWLWQRADPAEVVEWAAAQG